MSCNHLTGGKLAVHLTAGGKLAVPLDLPPEQKLILREEFFGGLDSCLLDLKTPERLRDPAATATEGAIFSRLLQALDVGEIAVPDEDARARIDRLAGRYDDAHDYAEITATHEAHRAIIDVLGRTNREKGSNHDA
jgi:hypothetical protein